MESVEIALKLLCIGAGGALGALSRFGVVELVRVHTRWPGWSAILIVNLLGAALVGAGYAFVAEGEAAAALVGGQPAAEAVVLLEWHWIGAFALTGYCGGLTTFSTLAFDVVLLFQKRRPVPAVVNLVLSLSLGTAAVVAGIAGARAAMRDDAEGTVVASARALDAPGAQGVSTVERVLSTADGANGFSGAATAASDAAPARRR